GGQFLGDLGGQHRSALLALFLELRMQYGKLLLVGIHEQIGQYVWLIGGIVGQEVGCHGSLGVSLWPLISEDVGQRGKERVLDGPKRFAPLTQEEWVFPNEVIDNENAALRPLSALR